MSNVSVEQSVASEVLESAVVNALADEFVSQEDELEDEEELDEDDDLEEDDEDFDDDEEDDEDEEEVEDSDEEDDDVEDPADEEDLQEDELEDALKAETPPVVVPVVPVVVVAKPAIVKSDDVVVNINTATAKQLRQVKGIGESLAAKVVRYRTDNGEFKDVDGLLEISGIKQKRLDSLRKNLTV